MHVWTRQRSFVPVGTPILCGMLGMCVVGTAAKVNRTSRGAIYARYSSRFQHSIDDQVRVCLDWAKNHGITVDEKHIYIDRAKTGRTHKRLGLTSMIEALGRDEFDVVITFATNRLYRKLYRSLQFVNEHVVDRHKRCVFVIQQIDTARKDLDWNLLMTVMGLIDEWQTKIYCDSIRAGHIGKALQELVCGTLAYGYEGVPSEGRKTRKGLDPEKINIHDEQAEWVRKIFTWYVEHEMTQAGIARRLNHEGAPLPPRANGKWKPTSVSYLLANRRYLGDWSYGWKESIWQNRAGYSRQFQREQPLQHIETSRLRLIDDEMFFRAQKLLARRKGRGGRRTGNGPENDLPYILKEALLCPKHDRPLIVNGSKGYMVCPDCKCEDHPELYSMLDRSLATRLICEKLAELIRGDADLVKQVIDLCRQAVERDGEPDGGVRQKLVDRERKLSSQIRFIIDAPGETERDQQENRQKLASLRVERASVEAEITAFDTARSQPRRVPDEQEVADMIDGLGKTLEQAANSNDVEIIAAARRIVHVITGGRILLSQQGQALAQRGWLRGTFPVNLVRPVAEKLDIQAAEPEPFTVSIDFRKPTEVEQLADEAKQLYDEGVLVKKIALDLSKRHGRNISRNTAAKALDHWYTSRGLEKLDGRTRRSTLNRKHVELTRCEEPALVQRVMDAYHDGVLLGDIATAEGLDRNTITAIVRRWHQQQGLSVPDGRARRKTLARKTSRQAVTA